MKAVVLVAVVCSCMLLFRQAPRQSAKSEQPCCALVKTALDDMNQIKVGMTRRELELHLDPDGGLQFAGEGRYVYPQCEYIKVDIQFKPAPPPKGEVLSPEDTVTKVSRPYIAYPARD